jgi:hypothetical protein
MRQILSFAHWILSGFVEEHERISIPYDLELRAFF